jgi:hypothetical protein
MNDCWSISRGRSVLVNLININFEI